MWSIQLVKLWISHLNRPHFSSLSITQLTHFILHLCLCSLPVLQSGWGAETRSERWWKDQHCWRGSHCTGGNDHTLVINTRAQRLHRLKKDGSNKYLNKNTLLSGLINPVLRFPQTCVIQQAGNSTSRFIRVHIILFYFMRAEITIKRELQIKHRITWPGCRNKLKLFIGIQSHWQNDTSRFLFLSSFFVLTGYNTRNFPL